MLQLYPRNQIDFTWNGEPIKHTYDEHVVRDEGWYLKFKVLLDRENDYKKLKKGMVVKGWTMDGEQAFRIWDITKGHGFLEIEALHLIYDLDTKMTNPVHVNNGALNSALTQFKSGLPSEMGPFTFSTGISKQRTYNTEDAERANDKYNAMDVFMDGAHSIVGTWEAELLINNWDIRLVESVGSRTGALLYEKKNIAEFEDVESNKSVITRIYAQSTFTPEREEESGSEPQEVHLSVVVESPLISDYEQVHEAIYINNDARTNQELSQWAMRKFTYEKVDLPERTIKVSTNIIDGTEIKYGDYLVLKYLTHDVEEEIRCVGYDVNPVTKDIYEVNLGTNKLSMQGSIGSTVQDLTESQLNNEMAKVAERVTKVIMSSNGFNRIAYGPEPVPNPIEGDLWYEYQFDTPNTVTLKIWKDGMWVILLDDFMQERLKEKMGEIESQAEELAGEIEASDQKATEAKEEAGLAKSAVDAFGLIVQETSDKMVDVEQLAATAETNATDALAKARESATTSSGALALAGQAVTDAQTAIDNAEEAQTDAQTAIDNAKTALSTADSADSKAGQAIAKADAIPTTITDIITDKNLVNGSYVDTKVNDATGAWSQELVRVEGKIDGLEIGGRNLVWSNSYVKTTKQFELTCWAARVYTNSEVLNMLVPGEIYTVSYDAEMIVKTPIPTAFSRTVGFILHSPTGQSVNMTTGKLTKVGDRDRVEQTFTCPPLDDHYILAYTNRYNTNGVSPSGYDTIRFTNFKIEKGNVATDWSPAPEDLYSQEDFKIFNAQYTQDVEGMTGRLTTVENNKLDGSTFQTFKQSEYQVTADKVASTVERVDTAEGKITTQGIAISQQADVIASKAEQTEVDTLSGTVSTHTTTLSQHDTAISSKAAQTEVDTVKGTVATHTSTLSQHAKDISARLTQTQVNSLVSDKGYSTVSYVDTQLSATAGTIRTEMTKVEGKIDGLEIGGRNLLKNTGATGGTSGWSGASIYELNGENVFKVAGTMSEDAQLALEPNQYYTTTMEIYPTVDVPITYSTPLHTYFRSSSSTNGGVARKTILKESSVAKANEWTRITEVVRTNQDITTYKFHVYYPTYINSKSPAYVRNIKFEKGNVATDWSPAPEDMLQQSDFNTFKAEYEQSAEGWSSKLLQIEQADYASKTWSNQTFATPQSVTTQLASYAKSTDLNGLVTETALANKSYITSSAVNTLLTSYAKTTALNGLATESYVGTQISTTAGAIRTEMTAIEGKIPSYVGGRNLFSKSNTRISTDSTKEFTLSGWAGELMNNQNVLSILEEGKTYTLSYDAELIERTDVPTFYAYQAGLYLYSAKTANDIAFYSGVRNLNEKARVEITFVCPPLSDQRFLYYTNRYTTGGSSPVGTDTIRITNLKLEKGSVATDWTPAPEDMATSKQVSSIKQTADSVQALVGTTNDSVARAVMTSNLWETEVSKVIDGELEQEYETVEGEVPFYEYTTPRSLLEGDRSMAIYLPLNADTTMDGKRVVVDIQYEVTEGSKGNHASYIQYGDIKSSEPLLYSSLSSVRYHFYIPPGTRNGNIMDLHTNIINPGNYTWAKITRITAATVEKTQVPVEGTNTGAISSKITQLYDMINLSVLGKEGAMSRIAMGEEGIQIDGKLLHITAKTFIDDAVIKSAMIDTLDAGKITTGELNASLIRVVNLDANSISGNEANFIKALFSGTTSTLQITSNGVNILDNAGKSSTYLDSSGIEFSRSGVNLGKLEYVTNESNSGDLYNMHGFSMRPNRNSYFGVSYFPSINATSSIRRFAVSGRTGNVYISGLIKPSEQQLYGINITWGSITGRGTNVRIMNHNSTGGIQINNGDLSYLSSGGWRSLNDWIK